MSICLPKRLQDVKNAQGYIWRAVPAAMQACYAQTLWVGLTWNGTNGTMLSLRKAWRLEAVTIVHTL